MKSEKVNEKEAGNAPFKNKVLCISFDWSAA